MNDDKTLADFLPKLNPEGELILGEFKSSASKEISKQQVIDKILLINDPELGINIYDLGLIYELKIVNWSNILFVSVCKLYLFTR